MQVYYTFVIKIYFRGKNVYFKVKATAKFLLCFLVNNIKYKITLAQQTDKI